VVLPCLGGRPITVGSSCLPTTTPMAKSLGIPDLWEVYYVSGLYDQKIPQRREEKLTIDWLECEE
jgi:hypothetical protein